MIGVSPLSCLSNPHFDLASPRRDRVADPDHATFKDLRSQAAAMDQCFTNSQLRERLEILAGLAEPKSLEQGVADLERLPDQMIESDTSRDHIAPGLGRTELDFIVPVHGLDRLGLDQRDLAIRATFARGKAIMLELPIAFQAASSHRNHLIHSAQRLPC